MSTYNGLTAILTELSQRLLPAGSVSLYAGSTIPSRWLLCNGAYLNISDYPRLYAAIGHIYDLASDSDADKFRIPDMRECVAVGTGLTGYEKNTTRIFDNTEMDPATGTAGTQNHDVYTLGQFKDDQMQDHTHGYEKGDKHDNRGNGTLTNLYVLVSADTDGASGRTGTTTHGKQVGLNYIIKY